MNKSYAIFNELKTAIIKAHPEVQSMIDDYEQTNKIKLDDLVRGFNHYRMS